MAETVGLVLGTAQLAQPYGVLARSNNSALSQQIDLIRLAESCRVVAIDTSPVYGGAEKAIGASGTQLEIHTKCHPNLSVEESLRISRDSLGRDTLDIVYLHESLERSDKARRKLRGLAEHVGYGVGAVGASVYEVDEFLLALDAPEVSVIQVPVSILDRRFAETGLLDRAANLGKKVFARSVLLQGLLVADSGELPLALARLRPYLDKVGDIADRNGVSRICLALSYVKRLPGLSGIIVGASSALELEVVASEFLCSIQGEVLDLVEQVEAAPWDLVDPRRWSR